VVANHDLTHLHIAGIYDSPTDNKEYYEMKFKRNKIVGRGLLSFEACRDGGCSWLSGSMLEALLWNCADLRVLKLHDCREVGLRSIKALSPLWGNLKTLALSVHNGLGTKCLRLIAGVCKKLTHLAFYADSELLRTDGLLALVESNPGLTSLKVDNISSVSVAGVVRVLWLCPLLTELRLIYQDNFSCAPIVCAIASTCGPNLERLTLRSLNISDAVCVSTLARAFNSLKVLDIHRSLVPSNDDLAAVSAASPLLEQLSISGYNHVTSDGIMRFAAAIGGNLEVFLVDCLYSVSDDAWYELFRKCSRLRRVCLQGCRSLSDRTFSLLVQSNPDLTDVNVSGCKLLTDASVLELPLSCPKLRQLRLSNVPALTDFSLVGLAEHCPWLESLHIDRCVGISDISMVAITEHCTRLATLSMVEICGISSTTLHQISRTCPAFETLHAGGCGGIDTEGLAAILKHCPKINHMNVCCCYRVQVKVLKACKKGQCISVWGGMNYGTVMGAEYEHFNFNRDFL